MPDPVIDWTYVPAFANPYPDAYDGAPITEFRYETPLSLWRPIGTVQNRRGKEDAEYFVDADYHVTFKVGGAPASVTVPRGMLTDLASVPRLLRWAVSQVGPHLEASIVHDFLYLAWQDMPGRGARRADHEFADAVLVAGLKEAEVGWFEEWLMERAVKNFGWPVYAEPNRSPRYGKYW
jgi:hypothetical protein